MWNLEVYSNTGMNTVNTIDKPSRLAAAEHEILPALDVLQGEGLTSIRVKATRSQVKDVDYAVLQDTETGDTFFYVVDGFTSTSKDVQVLSIMLDALLTLEYRLNGIENIQISDGIVERHHVNKNDDIFGAYTEDDPYLIPSKELIFDKKDCFTDMTTPNVTTSGHMVIETTLDLPALADDKNAITYTSDAGDIVTVPSVKTTETYTGSEMWVDAMEPTTPAGMSFVSPGTKCCDTMNDCIRKGMAKARDLGIDSAILNSYILPDAAVTQYSDSVATDGTISSLIGKHVFEQTDMNFEYKTVKNKRVLYGTLNSFVLMSPANGNSVSYKPEDIYMEGTDSPKVVMNTDPRPQGRPYFRFKYYKQDESDFMLNSLPGMQWADAPLIYSGKSGAWADRLNYATNTGILANNRNVNRTSNIVNTIGNVIGSLPGLEQMSYDNFWSEGYVDVPAYAPASTTALSTRNYSYMPNTGAVATGMERLKSYNFNQLGAEAMGLQIGMGMASAGARASIGKTIYENAYRNASIRETVGYITAAKVVAPELVYPMSPTMRDFRGNGCIVYRYRPQDSDIEKMDQILTMYGYKDTKVLESSDFTGRAKFNYVKANGVVLAGDQPLWLREAAAAQITAGVRIWHQLPDTAAYKDGSNV